MTLTEKTQRWTREFLRNRKNVEGQMTRTRKLGY